MASTTTSTNNTMFQNDMVDPGILSMPVYTFPSPSSSLLYNNIDMGTTAANAATIMNSMATSTANNIYNHTDNSYNTTDEENRTMTQHVLQDLNDVSSNGYTHSDNVPLYVYSNNTQINNNDFNQRQHTTDFETMDTKLPTQFVRTDTTITKPNIQNRTIPITQSSCNNNSCTETQVRQATVCNDNVLSSSEEELGIKYINTNSDYQRTTTKQLRFIENCSVSNNFYTHTPRGHHHKGMLLYGFNDQTVAAKCDYRFYKTFMGLPKNIGTSRRHHLHSVYPLLQKSRSLPWMIIPASVAVVVPYRHLLPPPQPLWIRLKANCTSRILRTYVRRSQTFLLYI